MTTVARRTDWKPEYTTKALDLIAEDDRDSAISASITSVLSTVSDDTDREAGRGRNAWVQALAVHAPDVEVPVKPDVDLGERGDKILRELQTSVEAAVSAAVEALRAAVSVPGQEATP